MALLGHTCRFRRLITVPQKDFHAEQDNFYFSREAAFSYYLSQSYTFQQAKHQGSGSRWVLIQIIYFRISNEINISLMKYNITQ